ncbi:MAG: sigma 54-interacting transcriptional regulator [Bryobacteraceae bacterium]
MPIAPWLLENGPRELESLLRAIVFHPSSAILIADDDRNYQDASIGASRFLGLQRHKIIGRRVEDFAAPSANGAFSERWQNFLKEGDQIGTLELLGPDGGAREVEYRAKVNVLPIRHLLLLRDKPASPGDDKFAGSAQTWAEDYALLLLDSAGGIVAFYAGAERIYGYKQEEVLGWELSRFYSPEDRVHDRVERRLKRATGEGHAGGEGWHVKKNGSRFWANVITMALRDEAGVLQGFASIVRDFGARRARDEKLERHRRRPRSMNDEPSIVGVVSGEFDDITEINDAFLKIVGYDREDLAAGRLAWADLTPKEYAAQDEFAHEEGLRHGACSPVEKELIRKDGTRVPVMVATAVLKIAPYRWITFVTDLRRRNRQESVHFEVADTKHGFEEIIGTSKDLRRVLGQVELVAPTDSTVLILGETGTGKELIARALHRLSSRRDFPFVSLNCAAIPTGLLESELFGYERGAFTGALQRKIGRFEMANRGTLFLDEIGDIPLELQPKLLRALQEKSFERLGSEETTPINIRLVAATNRNLTQMMVDKLFRGDLYYRLKVFPINLPPLRDRPDDISQLARYFTKKYADKMGRKVDRIPANTLQLMMNWSWPGNIRELENFIEKSVILSPGHTLCAPVSELRGDEEIPIVGSLEDVERAHILRVLGETKGVISAAAKRLRIPRTTLHSMMRKLGISGKMFPPAVRYPHSVVGNGAWAAVKANCALSRSPFWDVASRLLRRTRSPPNGMGG